MFLYITKCGFNPLQGYNVTNTCTYINTRKYEDTSGISNKIINTLQ